MLTRKAECPSASERRGLMEQLAEAIYEISLRRTLKSIKPH